MLIFSYSLVPLLFGTGLFAGTVDAVAGGGGLISLPVLLALGISPAMALGTNKLQTTVGTSIATASYYKHGLISLRLIYKGLFFGFVGAVLGAILAQKINADILAKIIPFILAVVLIYTLFSPKLGKMPGKPLLSEQWFYAVFGFGLGFYDGFLGPGTGSFWLFSLLFFLRYDLLKSAAYTKIFNLKSNIIATVCFAIGHHIDYKIALCMMMGQIMGGRIGALFAIRSGAVFIRPLFIAVVTTTITILIVKNTIFNALPI